MLALVTGGGGFLGTVIVRQLLERGAEVRSFSRSRYDHLEKLGATCITGDLADPEVLVRAGQGCDIVFHAAAKTGIWGPYQGYYQTNVKGTENVINACRKNSIGKLVYTSSPSVIYDGSSMEGVDETVPYPATFNAHYPQTKAVAEQMVLKADGPDLATVSLRPHLIWGPGDTNLVPRIINRAKAGRLFRVGKQTCLVDTVYVDNAAQAHLLAADKLGPGSPVSGKAYFITQDDPRDINEMIELIIGAAGFGPLKKTIPKPLVYAAGAAMEAVYKILNIKREPLMTRFLAQQLATAHWFDISRAKNDLNYKPTISIEEGIERLRLSL